MIKNLLIRGAILLAVGLLPPRIIQAQGTTYLSNLDQPSAGSVAAGSDSWLAALFYSGTNSGGYSLNSIQLAMADVSGNPSGFSVMLYSDGGIVGPRPGSNLGSLIGATDPFMGGTYTYTPTSNLVLSPNTAYFVVVTAETSLVDGAYEWSYATANNYDPSGGWYGAGNVLASSDGLSWPQYRAVPAQFAITATPVPEPGVLNFLGLGALGFVWHRRKAKTV